MTASLLLGVPIGIGMALLSTRGLTPLFTHPPPLVAIDGQGQIGLVPLASAISVGISLVAVVRLPAVQVLRAS